MKVIPDAAQREALVQDAFGRTGNLRAPTLLIGDDYYIGFSVAMYDSLVNG